MTRRSLTAATCDQPMCRARRSAASARTAAVGHENQFRIPGDHFLGIDPRIGSGNFVGDIPASGPADEIVEERTGPGRHQRAFLDLDEDPHAPGIVDPADPCGYGVQFSLHVGDKLFCLGRAAGGLADLANGIEQLREAGDKAGLLHVHHPDSRLSQDFGEVRLLQAAGDDQVRTQGQQFFDIRRAEAADTFDLLGRGRIVALVGHTDDMIAQVQCEEDLGDAGGQRDDPQLARRLGQRLMRTAEQGKRPQPRSRQE